jgi:hypothetical protein
VQHCSQYPALEQAHEYRASPNSALRQRMIEDMTLGNVAEKTQSG